MIVLIKEMNFIPAIAIKPIMAENKYIKGSLPPINGTQYEIIKTIAYGRIAEAINKIRMHFRLLKV